jgi:hypothetical protein
MATLRRFIRFALLCVAGPVGAQSRPASPEEARVRGAVESYLHGLKFNDVPSLQRAFWPDAKLYFVKRDSTLGQLSQLEWYKSFAASAGKEEDGTLGIVSIDITDNAATVKVLETYPKSVYVDYLNLLRFNGEWRIVNKIYTSRARSAPK